MKNSFLFSFVLMKDRSGFYFSFSLIMENYTCFVNPVVKVLRKSWIFYFLVLRSDDQILQSSLQSGKSILEFTPKE